MTLKVIDTYARNDELRKNLPELMDSKNGFAFVYYDADRNIHVEWENLSSTDMVAMLEVAKYHVIHQEVNR